MPKIRVAIAGVGNCASALVQGLQYYGTRAEGDENIGLRNPTLGGFSVKDIEVVAAFDIDDRKVGKDLSEAIFEGPNNTPKIIDVPMSNVMVNNGSVLDGVGEYTKNIVHVSGHPETNVAMILKESEAEMVLNMLPSGATKGSTMVC